MFLTKLVFNNFALKFEGALYACVCVCVVCGVRVMKWHVLSWFKPVLELERRFG